MPRVASLKFLKSRFVNVHASTSTADCLIELCLSPSYSSYLVDTRSDGAGLFTTIVSRESTSVTPSEPL